MVKYKEIDTKHYQNAIPNASSSLRASCGVENKVGEYYFLNTSSLLPYKNQARKIFNEEELDQLSETIKEHGVRQPLTVVAAQDRKNFFEILSGERRFRAAMKAGLKSVPCIIIKDYAKANELALIENIQRSDLHPVEFADAVSQLVASSPVKGLNIIATKLGKSVSTISEALSIAKIPEDIKDFLMKNNITRRDSIRKLSKLPYEQMRLLLGMDSVQKPHSPFSVLRITMEGSGYKIQDSGIKKLTPAEKEALKSSLLKLVAQL